MSLTSDLWELSHQLQQEHLFVSTERESLQRLYHNVSLLSERVFHTAWIARQQKINMQEFIDKGNHPGNPAEAYSVTNQLEETNFVDSYKVFSYHDSKYGELLKYLYENPNLLSATIIAGENYGGLDVKKMVSMTVTSVFGNCLFQEDEQSVLRLLKSLLEIQVANSDNPRRLIRRQNMSFSLVYKHLCDSLFSARLFLTAALYDPIMRLLMEDEWFFDIDPDKALVRFPPAEKLRRFGEPGTEENKEKLGQYRAFIVDKLVLLAERFIKSIKANIHCFPASLGWLVSQVYRVLTERGQVGMQEVRASCADLVFALFICPAICDPEPHGITSDVPISHIARHNLMQMAQIIQILAISQPEDIDVKTRDLYSRFDKGCMASVLDLFLEGAWEDMTEQITRSASSSSSPSPSPSFSSSSSSSSQGASRSAVMLTSEDVRELIGFLRNTSGRLDEKTPGKRQMEQLLSSLPADMPPSAADNLSLPGGSGVITPSSGSLSGSPFSVDSPIGTPSQEKKPLFKTKGQRKKRSMTAAPALEEILVESSEVEANGRPAADVLVVSIYPPGDCPGMLTERKVLSSLSENESKKVTTHPAPTPSNTATAATAAATTGGAHPEIQEKRTRFSLSHDQESIGNASDYQEVISEAASSHSVEDENELETDNFSDMMSANVSGRGSPSISGRDTPLSQAGSVEENPPAPQLPVPVPETVRKENRVDVTDRFGKFEIKAELAMEREECKSTVSDTWSTDVLASDSEPPEQNQVDRLEEVAEEIVRPPLLGSEPISEMSETASDAWSTDVLASDTEDKHSELLKDLELDLNCGVGDRDEGDSSLGHDEGEENCVDLDPMCAVGGAETGHSSSSDPHHGEVNEPFPEVFPEPSGKSGEESGGERGAGERGGASRKGNNMLFQFQSGPNLQLPSIHRPPSQSLKHAEGRVNATVHALEGSGGGSTALLPPSGVSGVQTSSGGGGGARSKVRDSREGGRRRAEAERRGSPSGGGGGGGGDDVAAGLEFDPLSSGGGAGGVKHHSRAGGKEKSWGRGHKQGSVDLPLRFEPRPQPSGSSGGEVHPLHRPDVTGSSSSSSSSGPPSDLPTPPTGGQARSGSRDSGIDLWVKTNGQMSGSSSRPQPTPTALIAARSSLDSNLSPPRYNSHVPGRASLDSNMQRIQAQGRAGGGGGMTSTPDSGLHSLSYMSSTGNSSSVDSNTPPLEMENPLFHLQHSHAVAAPHTKGGDNPPRLGAVLPPQHPHNSLSAVGDPFSVAATAATSGYNNGHSLLAGEGELVDVGVKDRSQLAGEGGLDGGVKGHGPLSETSLKHRNRKLRRSTPQIEVTDIYTKISVIEDVREEGSDSEESLAQQQVSNLDERRLSSALILLNTFSGDNDEPSGEITPAESSPAHAVKDFTSITFADSTSLISVDADDDSLEAHAIDSQTGHGEGEVKRSEGDSSSTHRRQDSSGSSQSANSFKLNTSSKDQAGDNVSLYSTDKEVGGDGEEAAGSKGKKTSGPGFLRSVRDKFNKGIKRKNTKLEREMSSEVPDVDSASGSKPSLTSQVSTGRETTVSMLSSESTDDILAKYRSPKKAPSGKVANNNSSSAVNNNNTNGSSGGSGAEKPGDMGPADSASGSRGAGGQTSGVNSTAALVGIMSRGGSISDSHHPQEDNGPPFFDPDNLEGCPAFEDAKRKLRMVLSTGDIYVGLNQVQSSSPREGAGSGENQLLNLLQAQMAEAINLQNKDVVAQLYEVIRCIKMFDLHGCKKLLGSMQEDYRARWAYISYLVRCRQGLLATRNTLQRLLSRVNRDKEICSRHLTNICARRFLERREKRMYRFIADFQKLSMSDEKIDLVEQFLQLLYQEMSTDVLWKAATDTQLEDGQQAVERFLMSRIYTHAMFPNGDGDIMRDQLLQEHLRKLSKVVSPTHKDLRIPHMYHAECPWPAAQKEIYMINAYRTPKDKIQCVLRCSQTIMNLLSMANEKSVPAADDFMPVLIFVLIKANPFNLLSTIQYVNSFYESRLHGEEQYWWLQLTSAVEFIKTMDYSH